MATPSKLEKTGSDIMKKWIIFKGTSQIKID